MDIKNLITFIYVAELCSFTKAAQILGYSQSTVSFQMKQLERELNTQLFERINHTVVLTDKGREVLGYAHQINRLAREMADNMQEEQAARGRVRLAMADSLCDSLLNRQYAEFRRRHPEIALKISTASTDELFRLMNQNEVDMVMTLDRHIYNAEYVIVSEEKVQMHLISSPDDPLCSRGPVSLEDCLDRPWLLTEQGMSYRRMLDEKLAGLSLEIQPVLETGRTDLICALAERGAGIAFLPEYVVRDKIEAGTLVSLSVKELDIDIWKQLIYHRDKWVSPQMKSVISYCIESEFGQ